MQHVFLAALLALAVSAPASADVGISVRIGQPGYYGRIDIGDYPSPMLVYPDPVVIVPPPGAVRGPLYLRVPPGHMHDWRRHCHRYSACGHRVLSCRTTEPTCTHRIIGNAMSRRRRATHRRPYVATTMIASIRATTPDIATGRRAATTCRGVACRHTAPIRRARRATFTAPAADRGGIERQAGNSRTRDGNEERIDCRARRVHVFVRMQ